MRMDRRGLISTLALGAAAPVAALAAGRTAPRGPAAAPALVEPAGQPPPIMGPIVDRARAGEVMARDGVEGLIVSDPINLYYLAGLELTQFMRSLVLNGSAYALVPRDPAKPVGLVLSSFGYHYSYSPAQPDHGVVVFAFTPGRDPRLNDPSNTTGLIATGEALAPGAVVVVPNAGEAPQRPLEQRREGRTRRNAAENGVAVSQSEALRKAAVALGMTKGRIGCDSPQGSDAWRMLGAVSDGVELVPALATISRIRLVKTPQEIAWMRYAALSNAAAASGACAAVRAGANSRELRQTFFAEAARRGGVPAWIAIDGVAAEAYTEDFRPGQAFMIDAVSTYSGYHGDFGRTVFVGEPQAHMRQHTDAIRLAWEAVRERLRPGLRFSEIQTIGQQALDKAPYRTVVRITPHSVGVLHTDAIGIGDIALEPGMIISVDFPVLESGIGGSAHLEDLTLITADGHELLNPATHPTITV